MEENTIDLVYSVVKRLKHFDINCLVFGGWAEELTKVIEPRLHGDIDLLCLAEDFSKVDYFLEKEKDLIEIKPKHFFHKRAFTYNNVMVELLLVQNSQSGNNATTNFWGEYKITWPKIKSKQIDVSKEVGTLPVVNQEALIFYRNKYTHIDKVRQRNLFVESVSNSHSKIDR